MPDAEAKSVFEPLRPRGQTSLEATIPTIMHNTSSPLLKLPLEIKNAIFELVLAGHIIEITSLPFKQRTKPRVLIDGKIRYVPQAPLPPTFRARIFKQRFQWTYARKYIEHRLIRLDIEEIMDGLYVLNTIKSPLGLLRSCKQINAEAKTVLYGKNTFFFHQVDVFNDFAQHGFNRAGQNIINSVRNIAFRFDSSTRGHYNDNRMESLISDLHVHCPRLKSFSFLLLSGYDHIKFGRWKRYQIHLDYYAEDMQALVHKWTAANRDQRDSPVIKALLEILEAQRLTAPGSRNINTRYL